MLSVLYWWKVYWMPYHPNKMGDQHKEEGNYMYITINRKVAMNTA